jgi:hypothetical protein
MQSGIIRAGIRWWWLAVPVVLTGAATYPITRNYFFGDDLLNIYDMANERVPEFLLIPFGGHLCIVRNAVYLLLFELFGAAPYGYHLSAVLTHVVNTALLCTLIRALTDSARLACFGGVLWGTAPVAEGTIGWFAASSHALSATALLLLLLGIVRVARRGAVSTAELWAAAALVFIAAASFGVGIAWALVLPAVVYLLVPPGPARRRVEWTLLGMVIVVVAAYRAMPHLAVALYDINVGWEPSPVLLLARWFDVADLTVNMTLYGVQQLLLGPFAHYAPDVWVVILVAVPVLLGVVVAGWNAPPSMRRAMLVSALLVLSTYGIIAAGRVPFYEMGRAMIIRSEHYHYSGTLVLTLLICLALSSIPARRIGEPAKGLVLAAWIVGLSGALVYARAPFEHFDQARSWTDETLRRIAEQVDRAPPGEDVYIPNRVFGGVGPFVIAVPTNFPGWAALFAIYHPTNVVDGHRVFFIEPDARVRAAAQRGLRTAVLVVAPESVPTEHGQPAPVTSPASASDVAVGDC